VIPTSFLGIGLPVYNGEEHVAQQIDSLLQQTFEDFELIIGDNHSTDRTEEICRDLAARDARIRYIRRARNYGATQNANLLFGVCKARYFKFAAHDDVHAPQYLSRCIDFLEDNPDVVLCHTGTVLIDKRGRPLPLDPKTGEFIDWSGRGWSLDPQERRLGSAKAHERYHDILHETRLTSEFWGVVRRDALARTHLLRSYFGSDRPLLASLALLGRFHVIPEDLFYLRRHPAHATSQSMRQRAEAVIPGAPLKLRMSSALVYRDFGRAILEADVSAPEKLRCLRSWLALAVTRNTLRKIFLPGRYNVFGIEGRSVAKPGAVSDEGRRLRARLERLSDSQLDSLLVDLEVDRDHPAPVVVEHGQRVAQLVRLLEDDNPARFRAWDFLEQINGGERASPSGLLPVGDELRARERALEHERIARAAHQGHDSGQGRITPERFYTFKGDAAWLGVFRDWDARRAFHEQLVRRVEQMLATGSPIRIAGITGRSGAGKTVALRRLGVDLAATGVEVWWVDDYRLAFDLGLRDLAERGDHKPRLVLLDDVHGLDVEDLGRVRQLLRRSPAMAFVVAGLNMPATLRSMLTLGDNLLLADEAADHSALLAKIGQVLPEWAERARALATQPLQSAPLLRLIVVLAHARIRIPRTLEELETCFLECLRDEVLRVKDVHPGFAEALLFAAMLRCLSRRTMMALANYYRPGHGLLFRLDGSEHLWAAAESLTFHDQFHDRVAFHHDELAEGVVEAARRGLFEPWVTFDDAWLRVALAKLVDLGSTYSSFAARKGLTRWFPDLVTGDDMLVASGMRAEPSESGGH
jgi:glycosyltransferase involved in cell wall biosynthesis